MVTRLFRPLGMTTAGFGAMGKPGKVEQPWQDDRAGRPVEPGPDSDNPPVMGPAGTVHCSLGDWGKFVADQLRGARGERALLRPETNKKLLSAPFPDTYYTVGGWEGYPKSPLVGGLILAHDGTKQIVASWNASHPNIHVNEIQVDPDSVHDYLVTNFAGGTAPDIVHDEAADIAGFTQQGYLATLNGLIPIPVGRKTW